MAGNGGFGESPIVPVNARAFYDQYRKAKNVSWQSVYVDKIVRRNARSATGTCPTGGTQNPAIHAGWRGDNLLNHSTGIASGMLSSVSRCRSA
jgi:hypothetical protein